jgi:hypothetical protein
LWIANAFINANGGKVVVESNGADCGTMVSIHLAVPPEAAIANKMPADALSVEMMAELASAAALEITNGKIVEERHPWESVVHD